MKLPADHYYFVYFCMLEEPAMFKPLSYSSVFVSIRDVQLTTLGFRQKVLMKQSNPVLLYSMSIFMS